MNKQSAHELWEGENSSLKKTFDEATQQTGTEKFIAQGGDIDTYLSDLLT